MQVTIYTTRNCPWCRVAKQFLAEQGVPFIERDVERDPAAAREMVQRSGQSGVPVILVDDEVVVGFDKPRLAALLAQRRNGAAAGARTGASGASGGARPSLGASVGDAARLAARAGGLPIFGALVGRVRPGSPAERAGLQPGDIIIEANLRPVRNADDLQAAVERAGSGSRLVLTVQRGDQILQREARL